MFPRWVCLKTGGYPKTLVSHLVQRHAKDPTVEVFILRRAAATKEWLGLSRILANVPGAQDPLTTSDWFNWIINQQSSYIDWSVQGVGIRSADFIDRPSQPLALTGRVQLSARFESRGHWEQRQRPDGANVESIEPDYHLGSVTIRRITIKIDKGGVLLLG